MFIWALVPDMVVFTTHLFGMAQVGAIHIQTGDGIMDGAILTLTGVGVIPIMDITHGGHPAIIAMVIMIGMAGIPTITLPDLIIMVREDLCTGMMEAEITMAGQLQTLPTTLKNTTKG